MSMRPGMYMYIPGRDTLDQGVMGYRCTEEDKRGRGGTLFR
jgi:hypothetical protein